MEDITPENHSESSENQALNQFNNKIDLVRNEVRKVIIGQEEALNLIIIAMLTEGHVLIEGVPGIAKTLMSKMFSKTINSGFSRIQFTPDLMPTDIIGTTVFDLKNSQFSFKHGPIFSNIVLIDEINRAPAKTQAALFEVMEERQISIDGTTYPISFPFMVVATQNPIEQEGTYKLPEAQLDRFLFRIKIGYPTLSEEKLILKRFRDDFQMQITSEVSKILTPEDLHSFQKLIESVYIKDELIDYIAEIIYKTRYDGNLFLGASPRASLSIMKAAKAMAAISNRDFVTPEDIQYVTKPILNHRIILSAEKEMEGTEIEDVIEEIVKSVEVPR